MVGTLAGILEHLTSTPANVSPATVNTTLSVASLLASSAISVTDGAAASIVRSLSNVIMAGALGAGTQMLPSHIVPLKTTWCTVSQNPYHDHGGMPSYVL